jgi:hypothetical protein
MVSIFEELFKFENAKFFSKSSPEVIIYYVTTSNVKNREPLIENLCENQRNEMLGSIKDIKEVSIYL